MTPEQKSELIQGAADLLWNENGDDILHRDDCLRIARLLFDVFFKPGGVLRHIPAGEVAQKFRERYDEQLADVAEAMIEKPLIDHRGLNPNSPCLDCGKREPCDNKCPKFSRDYSDISDPFMRMSLRRRDGLDLRDGRPSGPFRERK